MLKKTLIFMAVAVLLPIASLAIDIKIGVLLPFEGPESRTSKMVEFYRGVLMAADSLSRSVDVKIDITALNCGESSADMGYYVAKHSSELRDCDLIIGPQASAQVPALAEFCQAHGIRLVVPFSNIRNEFAADGDCRFGIDNLYVVSTPYSARLDEVAALFEGIFQAGNVVVLRTGDTTGSAAMTANAIRDNRLRNGLRIAEVNINDEGCTQRLESLVSDSHENVFVIDGASLEAVNKTFATLDALFGERQDVKVTVVGTPEWGNYVQQHLHNYYRYNTYIPIAHFFNTMSQESVAFENSYIRTFGTPMMSSAPRFAPMGFDVAMFFIRVLMGNAESDSEMYRLYTAQHPLQHGLLFVQDQHGGYVNKSVKYVHYSQSYNIDLLSR